MPDANATLPWGSYKIGRRFTTTRTCQLSYVVLFIYIYTYGLYCAEVRVKYAPFGNKSV
jgi:hypothetical protein